MKNSSSERIPCEPGINSVQFEPPWLFCAFLGYYLRRVHHRITGALQQGGVGKSIEVRRQINRFGEVVDLKTKSGRRRVDLSNDLLEVLSNLRRRMQEEAMKKGRNEISEWMFLNSRGNFIHSSTRTKQFKKVLRKAGLRDIRFHDLRHTFASQLLCNGANILYVSQQLGHSNPQITLKVYSHWIPDDNQREVINKLPSINERVRFQREDSVAK